MVSIVVACTLHTNDARQEVISNNLTLKLRGRGTKKKESYIYTKCRFETKNEKELSVHIEHKYEQVEIFQGKAKTTLSESISNHCVAGIDRTD